MECTAHGVYGTWSVWHMECTAHGVYSTWSVRHMECMAHGVYGIWSSGSETTHTDSPILTEYIALFTSGRGQTNAVNKANVANRLKCWK